MAISKIPSLTFPQGKISSCASRISSTKWISLCGSKISLRATRFGRVQSARNRVQREVFRKYFVVHEKNTKKTSVRKGACRSHVTETNTQYFAVFFRENPLKCKTADLLSTALLYNKGENDELFKMQTAHLFQAHNLRIYFSIEKSICQLFFESFLKFFNFF